MIKTRSYRYPREYDTLNSNQREAFDKMVAGRELGENFFLTGNAGTGKSYLANVFSRFCVMNGLALAKCAPTGIAALNIGGTTMHKLFRLGTSVMPPEPDMKQKINAKTKIRYIDVLFIDEISMARVDILDAALRQVYIASQMREKIGLPPVQVILCGDFGQLPPVIQPAERDLYYSMYAEPIKNGYCFAGAGWKYMDFKPLVLTQAMRQSDPEFCSALDSIKSGDAAGIEYINNNSSEAPIDGGIWLCGKNATARERNIQCLRELDADLYTFDAITVGQANLNQSNFESHLEFKRGARVMMILNDTREFAYCNGSLGTITSIRRTKSDYEVTVKFDNGKSALITPATLEFKDYVVEDGKLVETVIGAITQYPFKLGYAVTIHKAQGQTYDKANLVPEIFAAGQLYVALSRCRNAKNLYIQKDKHGRKLVPGYVQADDASKQFLHDILENNALTKPEDAIIDKNPIKVSA